jgi:hypothetical protein
MSPLEASYRLRFLVTAFAIPLLVIVAIACNGDDDNPPTTTGTPTTSPSDTGTPVDTQTPLSGSPSPSVSPSPSPTDPPTSLEGLAAAYVAGPDGKVAYRYTSNFGGKPDGIWTVYRDGDDLRKDWQTLADEIQGTTIVIVTGENGLVCTKAANFSQCTSHTPEEALDVLPFFIPVDEVPEAIVGGIFGLTTTDLPDETIAGVQATCFKMETPGRLGVGPLGTEEIEICFSAEGHLLRIERHVNFEDTEIPQGVLTAVAEEFGSVTAADIEPL